MDSLKDLPLDEKSEFTQAQKSAIEKYIGGAPHGSEGATDSSSSRWKIIGYTTVLFMALINPITQGILDKVPYFGGNNITTTLLTGLIFATIMTLLVLYG